MDKNKENNKEKKSIELQPLKKLDVVDFGSSDGFMCDVETGICGPINNNKEKKE